MGARVRAGAAGRVRRVGWAGGYGRLIELDHGAGWTSRYAHLHTSLVRVGQWVGAGAVIATVGATGLATGPHLHFEIRHQARALDPRTCLAAPPTQRPAAWVEGAR
jgi:murein DD-endopeptidase MepM/ murein hydrolase activator NlpD